MTVSPSNHDAGNDHDGIRGRRRRHLVAAAAGFVIGITLIAGTQASSATMPVRMYDSWLSDGWRLAPQQAQVEQRQENARAQQVRREPDGGGDRGRSSDAPADQSARDDTVVVTGEKPTSVSIPAMGVQAQVIPVGLDDGGGVFVPEDVRTLGWYTASVPVAADQGSAVIVGHRDSAAQGAGAFSGIENLQEGEVIEVTTADGDLESYTVDEVRMVDKTDFASIVNEAFAMNGEHRLTLITCGGAFDSTAGSYLSNVFVIATPRTT